MVALEQAGALAHCWHELLKGFGKAVGQTKLQEQLASARRERVNRQEPSCHNRSCNVHLARYMTPDVIQDHLLKPGPVSSSREHADAPSSMLKFYLSAGLQDVCTSTLQEARTHRSAISCLHRRSVSGTTPTQPPPAESLPAQPTQSSEDGN